jgi:hypothetical protein
VEVLDVRLNVVHLEVEESVLYSAARLRADDMLLYRLLCCAQSVLYSATRLRADDMWLYRLLCCAVLCSVCTIQRCSP